MSDPEINRQRLLPRYSVSEYRDRPKDYDPELCDEILEHICNGEMLPQVCERDHMPLPGTFLRWCKQDPNLQAQFDEAMSINAEVCLHLSVVAAHSTASNASTLSNSYRVFATKIYPAKYGERATLNIPPAEEPEHGGVNYAAEVRRKLKSLSDRLAIPTQEESAKKPGSGGDGKGA